MQPGDIVVVHVHDWEDLNGERKPRLLTGTILMRAGVKTLTTGWVVRVWTDEEILQDHGLAQEPLPNWLDWECYESNLKVIGHEVQ